MTQERAVSTILSHVLILGITTILAGSIILAAGTVLDTERSSAQADQIDLIGERLATELANVDRIADDRTTINATTDHPEYIVDTGYTVELYDSHTRCDGKTCLVLTTWDGETSVSVPVPVTTPVEDSMANGGPVRIVYNGDQIRIEGERR